MVEVTKYRSKHVLIVEKQVEPTHHQKMAQIHLHIVIEITNKLKLPKS